MMNWEAHPLSFSQIKVAKRCLWRYNQEYNLGVQRRTKRGIIAEGDFIHRLLARMAQESALSDFDKSLFAVAGSGFEDWRKMWERIKGEYEGNALFEEEAVEIGDLSGRVFNIVERYEAQVWLPFFSQAEIIYVEDEIVLGYPKAPFPVVIKPDLVVRLSDGSVWLVDHKTTRDFEEELETNLRYDDQINLYLWALRQNGIVCAGAIHDMIRTRLPRVPEITKKGLISRQACVTDEATVRAAFSPVSAAFETGASPTLPSPEDVENYVNTMKMSVFFKQVPTFRSDELLDKLAAEYGYAKRIIDQCASDGYWPRTFMTRDCPLCPLRELCMADLQGGDVESLMQSIYKTREEKAEPRGLPPAEHTEGGVE